MAYSTVNVAIELDRLLGSYREYSWVNVAPPKNAKIPDRSMLLLSRI
jgi:hypothetical protein